MSCCGYTDSGDEHGLHELVHGFKTEGQFILCESVTSNFYIGRDPITGWFFAVDSTGQRRAVFKFSTTARRWCHDAERAFTGLPETNIEIQQFHDAMTKPGKHGWEIGQHLGYAFVWSVRPPPKRYSKRWPQS